MLKSECNNVYTTPMQTGIIHLIRTSAARDDATVTIKYQPGGTLESPNLHKIETISRSIKFALVAYHDMLFAFRRAFKSVLNDAFSGDMDEMIEVFHNVIKEHRDEYSDLEYAYEYIKKFDPKKYCVVGYYIDYRIHATQDNETPLIPYYLDLIITHEKYYKDSGVWCDDTGYKVVADSKKRNSVLSTTDYINDYRPDRYSPEEYCAIYANYCYVHGYKQLDDQTFDEAVKRFGYVIADGAWHETSRGVKYKKSKAPKKDKEQKKSKASDDDSDIENDSDDEPKSKPNKPKEDSDDEPKPKKLDKPIAVEFIMPKPKSKPKEEVKKIDKSSKANEDKAMIIIHSTSTDWIMANPPLDEFTHDYVHRYLDTHNLHDSYGIEFVQQLKFYNYVEYKLHYVNKLVLDEARKWITSNKPRGPIEEYYNKYKKSYKVSMTFKLFNHVVYDKNYVQHNGEWIYPTDEEVRIIFNEEAHFAHMEDAMHEHNNTYIMLGYFVGTNNPDMMTAEEYYKSYQTTVKDPSASKDDLNRAARMNGFIINENEVWIDPDIEENREFVAKHWIHNHLPAEQKEKEYFKEYASANEYSIGIAAFNNLMTSLNFKILNNVWVPDVDNTNLHKWMSTYEKGDVPMKEYYAAYTKTNGNTISIQAFATYHNMLYPNEDTTNKKAYDAATEWINNNPPNNMSRSEYYGKYASQNKTRLYQLFFDYIMERIGYVPYDTVWASTKKTA